MKEAGTELACSACASEDVQWSIKEKQRCRRAPAWGKQTQVKSCYSSIQIPLVLHSGCLKIAWQIRLAWDDAGRKAGGKAGGRVVSSRVRRRQTDAERVPQQAEV